MGEKDPLYAVMIPLAEANRWLDKYEIARETGLNKMLLSREILYSHPDLFECTDECLPRWQLTEQFRKRHAPNAPAKVAVYSPGRPVSFTFRNPSILSPTRETERAVAQNKCNACETVFLGNIRDEIALCSNCSIVRRSALEQFAAYNVALPTMKDFNLYENS